MKVTNVNITNFSYGGLIKLYRIIVGICGISGVNHSGLSQNWKIMYFGGGDGQGDSFHDSFSFYIN